MIWRLKHPWWLHLPMLISLGICVVASLMPGHWPNTGFAKIEWALPSLILACYLAIDVAKYESWVRAENGQKRFDYDPVRRSALAGMLAGMQIGFCSDQNDMFNFFVAGTVIAFASAAILEWLRKPIIVLPASSGLPHAKDQIFTGNRWTYFTIEHTPSLERATYAFQGVVMLIFLLVILGHNNQHSDWVFPCVFLLLVLQTLARAIIGTVQIQVNPARLVLRSGLGFSLLRLESREISKIDIETINPIADYGGWGIRRRNEERAYLFGGTQVVRLETLDHRKFAISCREPDRLADAIRVAVSTGGGRPEPSRFWKLGATIARVLRLAE